MTREEELDWLYRLRSEIYVYMPGEWLIPMNDALDMAIKASEQEPSGDLISRDELLKAIDTWDKFGVDDTNSLFRLDNLSLPHYVPYIHYDDMVKSIKGMPTVQAVPLSVLQEIRQEIEKPLRQERFFDTETAKAQAIALNHCLEIVDKHIKQLREQTKWIPVSVRLPEKESRYLTTILNEHDNRLRYVMTCDYFSNGCWCPDDECASSNVIAWMPLPPCFEPQESEDKG